MTIFVVSQIYYDQSKPVAAFHEKEKAVAFIDKKNHDRQKNEICYSYETTELTIE